MLNPRVQCVLIITNYQPSQRYSLKHITNNQKNLRQAGCQWFAHAILATSKAEIERIKVQGQSAQTVQETPISKKNQSKMDWRCGSSRRMPALQEESLEFKYQSHKKERDYHLYHFKNWYK
jgi:hypothetical protein